MKAIIVTLIIFIIGYNLGFKQSSNINVIKTNNDTIGKKWLKLSQTESGSYNFREKSFKTDYKENNDTTSSYEINVKE